MSYISQLTFTFPLVFIIHTHRVIKISKTRESERERVRLICNILPPPIQKKYDNIFEDPEGLQRPNKCKTFKGRLGINALNAHKTILEDILRLAGLLRPPRP